MVQVQKTPFEGSTATTWWEIEFVRAGSDTLGEIGYTLDREFAEKCRKPTGWKVKDAKTMYYDCSREDMFREARKMNELFSRDFFEGGSTTTSFLQAGYNYWYQVKRPQEEAAARMADDMKVHNEIYRYSNLYNTTYNPDNKTYYELFEDWKKVNPTVFDDMPQWQSQRHGLPESLRGDRHGRDLRPPHDPNSEPPQPVLPFSSARIPGYNINQERRGPGYGAAQVSPYLQTSVQQAPTNQAPGYGAAQVSPYLQPPVQQAPTNQAPGSTPAQSSQPGLMGPPPLPPTRRASQSSTQGHARTGSGSGSVNLNQVQTGAVTKKKKSSDK